MLIFGGSWFSCFGVDVVNNVGDNAIDIAGVDENGIDVADAAGDLHLDFFPFFATVLHSSSFIYNKHIDKFLSIHSYIW